MVHHERRKISSRSKVQRGRSLSKILGERIIQIAALIVSALLIAARLASHDPFVLEDLFLVAIPAAFAALAEWEVRKTKN